ncbi:MAG: hypothetical protein EOP56_17325 [Sphingobacteriales bacterium]|nr:MAG: hypothetical protein EOP56_17325 [Sphingobacteriales bacterium]
MRYLIVFLTCALLSAGCSGPDIAVHPTTSYDTLGIKWMVIERNNITYYFQGTGEKGASVFTDMHEEAYTSLDEIFKAKLPRKLRFFVWTNSLQAEQMLNRQVGFAQPKSCICHINANQSLGHEMTHILSYWADGVEPTSFSRFINEDIAVAFDLSKVDRVERAKKAVAGGNIGSVAMVWSGNKELDDEVLYPLAGAFVEFLYHQNTRDQFNTLMKKQTLEDAQDIYGKERLEAWIKEFDALVGL